jgi:hypothetical protein
MEKGRLIENGRKINPNVFFSAGAHSSEVNRANPFPAQHKPIRCFQYDGASQSFTGDAEPTQHAHDESPQ